VRIHPRRGRPSRRCGFGAPYRRISSARRGRGSPVWAAICADGSHPGRGRPRVI